MKAGQHHVRCSNPIFNETKFDQLVKKWRKAVGEETLAEDEISDKDIRHCCEIICTQFPRGNEAGKLLHEPIIEGKDGTPLGQRGVSMKWLYHALEWMRKTTGQQSPPLPTRFFVALFVEPLVCDNKDTILPLYYYIPVSYRGTPDFLISHGWDSWLRHLLFFPKECAPGKLLRNRKNNDQDAFVWLDVFAIVQDPGSALQESEVAGIQNLVRTIRNTCIVVPGQGTPEFALLPARRSWCCLEIAMTPESNLSARVGVHRSFFLGHPVGEYHERLLTAIEQLDCAKAETSCAEEQRSIQCVLDRELGRQKVNRIVKAAILRALAARYRGWKAFGIFTDALNKVESDPMPG